jgi:hypothetical protein
MRKALAILAVYGALASYLAAAEPVARHTVIDTREAMVAGINSAAVAIWDISSEARGEEGELDPTRMTDDSWSQLRDEAQSLESWARMMAEADTIHAAGPDLASCEVSEGVASRAEIQAMIDARPEMFRASARDLAERAGLLVAAARARDAAAAGHRAAEIDVPCQGCHTRYWYNQNPPQVEKSQD